MNNTDSEYFRLIDLVLSKGRVKHNRTGVDTIGVFGAQARFNLQEGFPLLTTKKVFMKAITHELLWFLSGSTNIKYLVDNDVHIWDDWREPYGFKRQLVFLDKKARTYENYHGNFSWDGYEITGETDIKLAYTWVKMMRRCYDAGYHNFLSYGGVGVSVCKDWHNPKIFVEQVKKIPHWWYKEKYWNDFELDKDYYGAKQYGLDTSVWLHTKENNYYTKAAEPVQVTDANGNTSIYLTANDAAREIGISQSSFNRILNNGFPKIVKGNNRNYIGWDFDIYEPKNKLLRMELIPDGELGHVYGKAWRDFDGVDQIVKLIETLKTNPDSRRLIVSAWHPYWVDHCALPPCHCLFQFNTEELTFDERYEWACKNNKISMYEDTVNIPTVSYLDSLNIPQRRLNCQLYQRSCDLGLGVPFNIASYALLTHMMAQVSNMVVGDFIHTYGDLHIYENHIEALKEQRTRTTFELPKLQLNPSVTNLFDFKYEDIKVLEYKSNASIKMDVAV